MASESENGDPAAIDDLSAAAGRVSLELEALAEQVRQLVAAVESLAPAATAAPEAGSAAKSPSEGELVVSVSPLPELAMAAVAETALRGLPMVEKVTSVERSNDQATFILEVAEGGDLVTEMRGAMPVPITVDKAPDGSLKVALEWAWGRSSAGTG